MTSTHSVRVLAVLGAWFAPLGALGAGSTNVQVDCAADGSRAVVVADDNDSEHWGPPSPDCVVRGVGPVRALQTHSASALGHQDRSALSVWVNGAKVINQAPFPSWDLCPLRIEISAEGLRSCDGCENDPSRSCELTPLATLPRERDRRQYPQAGDPPLPNPGTWVALLDNQPALCRDVGLRLTSDTPLDTLEPATREAIVIHPSATYMADTHRLDLDDDGIDDTVLALERDQWCCLGTKLFVFDGAVPALAQSTTSDDDFERGLARAAHASSHDWPITTEATAPWWANDARLLTPSRARWLKFFRAANRVYVFASDGDSGAAVYRFDAEGRVHEECVYLRAS